MKRQTIRYLGGNVADRSNGEGRTIQGGEEACSAQGRARSHFGWGVVSSGCSGGRSGWGGFGEADLDCTQRGGKPLEGLERGVTRFSQVFVYFPLNSDTGKTCILKVERERWKMLSAGDRIERKFSKER